MTKAQRLAAQIIAKLDELKTLIEAADITPQLEVIDTKITVLQGILTPVVTEG